MVIDLEQAAGQVAVRLGVLEGMSGATRLDHIAERTQVPSSTLHRLMRGLVHYAFCLDLGSNKYQLTRKAEDLQRLNSKRADTSTNQAAEMLLYSIRTGKPAFEHAFGMAFFQYLDEYGSAGGRFGELMSVDTETRTNAIASAFDFSQAHRVVDVGGGFGQLAIEILKVTEKTEAMVLDRPKAVAQGHEAVRRHGLEHRCHFIAGDFFDAVPAGADVYIYSQILHDWDDDHCTALLHVCRSAVTAETRLLLIEALMPEEVVANSPVVELDLMMLLLTGGRERTLNEYAKLLSTANFVLSDVRPIDGIYSMLVAKPNLTVPVRI